MSEGYVYVLSNPAMPGLIKVGRSIHGGRARAAQIYQTGTPQPFVLEFEVFVKNSAEVERQVHDGLSAHRVNNGREFFSVSVKDAVEAVAICALDRFGATVIQTDVYDLVNDFVRQRVVAMEVH